MVEYKYFNKVYKDVIKKNYLDSFVFFKDNWNDYGYYITFNVYYYGKDGDERYIGSYRIYEAEIEQQEDDYGNKSIFKLTKNDFDRNQKYSLARNIEFYQNLYEIGLEDYNEFLVKNNDLTIIDLPNEIRENEGVKKALLRNDGITKSEDIIDSNRLLKEINLELNVGNCVSKESYRNHIFEYLLAKLKDNDISDENKSLVFKIVEGCNYNFELLNNLVKYFLDNPDYVQYQEGIDILTTLVERANFDQLKSELETINNEDLKIISTSVKNIKGTLRYSEITGDDSFIHYTSLNTLKFLLYKIEDKNNYPRLRLSNARQMNDPNEGYTFLDLIGIDKKKLAETDYDTSPFFFASMTQTGDGQKLDDSLPMWKQYGDDARGICLTYHKEYIENLLKDGVEIYKVCYNTDELRGEIENIKKVFDKIKDPKDVKGQNLFSSALNLIDDIRYLFKDADYSYENEFRIIKSYEGEEDLIITCDSSNSVIPGIYTYIEKELKYSKIKLGPKCDDIDFVAPYIKFVDRNIEVTKSQISYR